MVNIKRFIRSKCHSQHLKVTLKQAVVVTHQLVGPDSHMGKDTLGSHSLRTKSMVFLGKII